MKKTCIVIGASHAAAQLCASLRQEGWDGEILMIGEEAHLPYHRPPLSKTFLSGEKSAESLLIRPAAFYEKQQIGIRQGRVTSIDREQKTITLSDGDVLAYDKLALCVGSRVRTVAMPGSDLSGVHYLRDIAHGENIKQDLGAGKHAVIVGGGYIGLEAAASLNKLGMHVTVLEMAPRILQRVTAPEISDFYARMHAEEGVDIQTDTAVSQLAGDGRVQKVICADGREFPADLVVIGVGILPNVELAEDAGIRVDDGILVDDFCRTNDPDILAAGDCTNHFNPIYRRRMRLESVPNAGEQGKTAAAMICGREREQNSLPWFWSDQYDVKLQIAGVSHGYEQIVVRGDRETGRSFAVFYFSDGRLIAADCVNRAQEFMLSKKIIAGNLAVDPVRLADESIVVKELLPED